MKRDQFRLSYVPCLDLHRTLDKLTSTEIYSILISKIQNKPSSNIYFENMSNDYINDWTASYMLPR